MANQTTCLLDVDVQIALNEDMSGEQEEPPSADVLSFWAQAAYGAQAAYENVTSVETNAELTIRLVDQAEIRSLNRNYRQKDSATNVLAFPFEMPNEIDEQEMPLRLLGDIVICHSVLVAEAKSQDKTLLDHYAHIVTHGVLHLCGYDHIQENDATEMESLEITILAKHSIANPYH